MWWQRLSMAVVLSSWTVLPEPICLALVSLKAAEYIVPAQSHKVSNPRLVRSCLAQLSPILLVWSFWWSSDDKSTIVAVLYDRRPIVCNCARFSAVRDGYSELRSTEPDYLSCSGRDALFAYEVLGVHNTGESKNEEYGRHWRTYWR